MNPSSRRTAPPVWKADRVTSGDLAADGARPSRLAALRTSAVLTGRLVGVAVTVVAAAVALSLVVVLVGVWLFPACVRALRAQAIGLAATHARDTGVELRVPPLPAPTGDDVLGRLGHTWALLSDGGTWRLLRWAALDSCTGIGIVLAIMPLGTIGWGIEGLVVLPALWLIFRITPTEWYAFIPVFKPAAIPYAALLAIGFIAFGYLTGPWWLRLHGRWAAALLGTGAADLRERVDTLTASRAQTRQVEELVRSGHGAPQRRSDRARASAAMSTPACTGST